MDGRVLNKECYKGLMNAISKDCEAGNLASSHQFHDENKGWIKVWISITYIQDSGIHDVREVRVYEESTNVLAWLKENKDAWFSEEMHGITVEEYLGN